jgi:hypothetical protein
VHFRLTLTANWYGLYGFLPLAKALLKFFHRYRLFASSSYAVIVDLVPPAGTNTLKDRKGQIAAAAVLVPLVRPQEFLSLNINSTNSRLYSRSNMAVGEHQGSSIVQVRDRITIN